jgi:ribose/xylose/arabinose/galactoside ABC-type transport system permease subunit
MGTLRNGLILMGVDMYWQTVSIGVIIIAVCALDSMHVLQKRQKL